MATGSEKKSSAERVREYRARKRAAGYRLMQRWVPDVTTEEFKREAHRQSRLIAEHEGTAEDQAFIDAISVFNEESEFKFQ